MLQPEVKEKSIEARCSWPRAAIPAIACRPHRLDAGYECLLWSLPALETVKNDRSSPASGPAADDGPAISEPETLLQTRFLAVTAQSADFGSFVKDYHVIGFQPRAGIVIVREGMVLLVKQWRFLLRGDSWELPGGSIDPGEDPAAGARRECREESGIVCGAMKPLCRYFPGLDNVDNETHLFSCHDIVEEQPFQPTASEVLERGWFPLEALLADMAAGRILDAMTILGLSFYAVQRSGIAD